MKMDSNDYKWARQVDLEGLFNLKWTMPRKDMLEIFYKLGQQQRMEEFKGEYMVKKLSSIKYLFMSNLEFPRKE